MKKHPGNRVFMSFVISYLIVLMIPYGIGIWVYEHSVELLSEQISKAENATLTEKVELIDAEAGRFRSVMAQLSIDSDLGLFINSTDPYRNANDYYAMSQTKRQMRSMVLGQETIANITVFSTKNQCFVSSAFGSVYQDPKAFPYHELWGISADDFSTLLQSAEQDFQFYTNLKTGEMTIFLVTPVVLSDVGHPEGIILAQMSRNQALDPITGSLPDRNAFLIMNKDRQVISNNPGLQETLDLDFEAVNVQNSSYSEIVSNGDYLINYRYSTRTGWTYLSVVDMANYLKDINDYKFLILLYVVISVMVGILIAFYISRLKYKPIRKLKLLSAAYQKNKSSESDDYRIIEDSMFNMIHTMDSYKDYFEKQERKNLSWYFSQILRGWHVSVDSDFDTEELKSIRSRVESSNHCVLVYQLDDFTEMFYAAGMDMKEENTVLLVSFIVTNIFEEYFGEYGALHVLSLDSDHRFVIPIAMEGKRVDYVEIARNIKDFMVAKFGIIGSFAISNVHKGREGIRLGYEEAIDTLEYKDIIGSQNTVTTFDAMLSESGNGKLMFNIEKEKIFVNFILIEDFKAARRAILNLIDEDLTEVRSLQILKVKLFGMINKMMYALMSLSEKSEYYDCIDQNLLDKLLHASSIPELTFTIDAIFDRLIEVSEQEDNASDVDQKTQEILGYIRANLRDPNLSVAMIAEAFHVTASNLSKFMTKEMGQSTLDHIHIMRIQEAKKLLKETEDTLVEIAEKVGYYNYRTLVTRFKKYEGVTPTQYREQIQ